MEYRQNAGVKLKSGMAAAFAKRVEPNFWQAPDGMRLAWDEYGDPTGEPVFFYHGWPSSRLQARLAHEFALARQIRLIAPDRPGMGRSDWVPGRTLQDWPARMRDFSDFLRIGQFSQIGVSGGGPYVFACAAMIPDRVNKSAVLCGAVPLAVKEGGLRGLHPIYRLLGSLRNVMPEPFWSVGMAAASIATSPALRKISMPLMLRTLPRCDQQVLTDFADTLPFFVESFREGIRQGGRGVMSDAEIYFQPWSLSPELVRKEIRYWHGSEDQNIPLSRVEAWVAKIPRAQLQIERGMGHFSLALLRCEEAMDYLIRPGKGADSCS